MKLVVYHEEMCCDTGESEWRWTDASYRLWTWLLLTSPQVKP